MLTDVSVLGLGLMGAALVRAFLDSGQKVTVWNRTAEKAAPLIAAGASAASSIPAALMASPFTVVCVDNYHSSRAMFAAGEVAASLAGRIIVQLTTETPNEAREAGQWFTTQGARYIDGAILCGPPAIATPRALLLYAGDRDAFEQCRPVLMALGDATRFVSENVAAAATLDFAWLSRIAADFMGIYHGAVICKSEGIALAEYAGLFSETDFIHFWLEPLLKNDFGHATAPVSMWRDALQRLSQQAREAGICSDFPDFVDSILARTEAAGYRQERVAAIVKILGRAESRPA